MSKTATAVQVVLINPGSVITPWLDNTAGNAKRERMLQPMTLLRCATCACPFKQVDRPFHASRSWAAAIWAARFIVWASEHHRIGCVAAGPASEN